jgi:uncharacterized protein (DUF885 family)
MTIVYILLGLLVLLLAWFLIALIRGKPWSVKGLYTRTFLKFALKGPELLTMLGILEKFGLHGHNAKLSDASEAFQDRMFAFVRRDLGILRSYPRKRQSKATLLSTDVMDFFLDDIVRGERFRHHDYPLNQMFGIQSEMPNFMLTMHPVVSKLEGRDYVKRLSRFGVKFDQVMEGLVIREKKGILPPKFVIRRVLDEMTAFVAKPANENPLYTVFKDKLEKLPKVSARDRESLLAAVEAEIARMVYPAYQKFIAYFTELEKKATADDGVWKLPNGAEYYAHCLRSMTSTDYTPQQVHEIGVKEVERIEGEMRTILEESGYKNVKSPAKQLHDFGTEERFLYPNTDEGRDECRPRPILRRPPEGRVEGRARAGVPREDLSGRLLPARRPERVASRRVLCQPARYEGSSQIWDEDAVLP